MWVCGTLRHAEAHYVQIRRPFSEIAISEGVALTPAISWEPVRLVTGLLTVSNARSTNAETKEMSADFSTNASAIDSLRVRSTVLLWSISNTQLVLG